MTRHLLAALFLLVAPVAAWPQGSSPADGLGAPAEAPPPLLAPPPRFTEAPPPPRWVLSGSLGAGTSMGGTYLLVGARVGYLLAFGFGLELEGQYWAGNSPLLGKVAPGLTWHSPEGFYAGAYWARWLIGSGYPDEYSAGARAGFMLAGTGRASLSAGLAYERVLNCSSRCEAMWPEAGVGVRF